jgi:hypothetical protein
MPTTLTGSSSYSNTASGPADGDTRNAASVNTPLQTVLNNTKWLYDHGRLIYSGVVDTNSTGVPVDTTTWTDSGYSTLSIAGLEVGDIVIVQAFFDGFASSVGAVATEGWFRAVVVDNAVEYSSTRVAKIRYVTAGTARDDQMSVGVRRVIGTAGTATVKLQSKVDVADGSNNVAQYQNAIVFCSVFRPVS